MGAASAFAAVLLSDIARSTELRVRLGAGYTRLLREHDELISGVLSRYGASTPGDTGDGFLATFDSTISALQAACAMQWAVAERNASVPAPQQFSIRVVLAAGELYGRPEKRSGMALVDAARLESTTEADEVRCTDVFRLLAAEQFPHLFSEAAQLMFQGVPEPRLVWRVDWRAAPPYPSDLPLPAPLASGADEQFVGRELELAQLSRAWNAVPHSGHRLVLLQGGVGMGKSALARRFAQTRHEQRSWVLYGRCDAESLTPFQPFAEALSTFVRDTGGSRQLLGRFPERLERLLDGPLDATDLPAPAPAVDQEAERFVLFEAVAEWLALISAQEPVLLVIDDLNRADRATLELLRHVLHVGHLGSVCIVATCRTAAQDQTPAFRLNLPELERLDCEIDVLTLAGLTEAQVYEATALRAGSRAPAVASFARDLWTYTEGNPLFVQAIVSDLGPRAVARLASTDSPGLELRELGVPSNVRDLFRARYERLDDVSRGILDIACLMTPSVDRAAAERALGYPADAFALGLDLLIRADLLRPARAGLYEFSHAVMRDAALVNLQERGHDGAGRSIGGLHVAVARAIEGLRDRHVAAGELSHYLARSDNPADWRAAADYAVVAGDRAMASLAPGLAARHYRQALDLSQRLPVPAGVGDLCDLQSKLGYALKHAGDPEATECLLAAARSAARLGDPRRMARTALASLSDLWSITGSVDEDKVAVLRDAIAALGDDDATLRSRLLAGLAAELTFAEEADERQALIQNAVDLARRTWEAGRRTSDATTLARVLEHRHTLMLDPDGLAQRRADVAELDVLSSSTGPYRAFTAASLGSWTAIESGAVEDCRSRLRQMRDISSSLDQPRLAAVTRHWSSSLATLFGQFDEAERLTSEVYELFRAIGNPDALVFSVGLRYIPMWLRGQLKELIDDLEACSEAYPGRVGIRAGLAHSWAVLGDLVRSAEMLDTIELASLRAHQDQLPTLAMVTMAAAASSDAERCAITARLLQPYRDQFVFNGTACFGSARHYLALAATVTERFDDADHWFHGASLAHAELPAPALLALTKLEWAKMLLRRRAASDALRARVLLEDALTAAHGLVLPALESECHLVLVGETG